MARSIAKASLAAVTLGLAILSWNRIELGYFLQVVDGSRSDNGNDNGMMIAANSNNNNNNDSVSFSSWKRKHPPGLGHGIEEKGDIDIVDGSSHEKQKKHGKHSSTTNATTATSSHHVTQNQHSKITHHSSKDQSLSRISQQSLSPACHPHFKVSLPNGNWTTNVKFKRIYFYHSRKAGVSNIIICTYYISCVHYLVITITQSIVYMNNSTPIF